MQEGSEQLRQIRLEQNTEILIKRNKEEKV